MTITNGYCELAEIKEKERLDLPTKEFDTALEGCITAVSRSIDLQCGGRFFWKDTNDGTYYFNAFDERSILIGDFASITSVSIDISGSRTYTDLTLSTHYDLWPYNAVADGRPYQGVEIAPVSGRYFPVGINKGVKIVGKRGWPAVPANIKEACILWSMRMYKRYSTVLGISGMSALGETNVKVPPPDPDVMLLLSEYILSHIG